ncbi:nuclear transport factor 2 family protein [Marinifilum sp.]|uniref:nuclear transport factor 2 family protein n=1 Tax=Marinifilum sp. TaxID=2033137 RepID=UPI003BA8CC06
MRIIILLLIMCMSGLSSAQINMERIQKEIDKTVWIEFKSAFERIDAKALNALYADQTLRVSPKGIDTENHFKAANLERFQTLNESSAIVKLDFWFESRHTNQNTSYEVGYYRIVTKIGDENSIYYGQFHIVLKKISGSWKIVQDWDTAIINGKKIGKIEFERMGTNQLY